MMGLFKGKLSADRVFDTISDGVDKLIFTDEERTDLNLKLADKVVDFAKDSLSESTIRSKTRRFISIAIISVFLLLVLLYVTLAMIGDETEVIKDLLFDSPLSTGFIMVLAFFYGGYYLKALPLKRNNKQQDNS